MTSRRIPVVIVAGFLGAGKTTLLNHLLTNRAGARIGVLVNDFGSIGIDAMAVAGQVDSMVSLGNGCLCCAVDTSMVDEMLGRLSRPSAAIDVIVIEASGLAEPRDMVRLVLNSANPDIEYGGLLEVVDAAEFESTLADHPELAGHLAFADLIVLNKTDRVSSEHRETLISTLRGLAPGTPVIPTTEGRLEPTLLFDDAERTRRPPRAGQLSFADLAADDAEHRCEDGHPHHSYDSVSFVEDRPMHPRRLTAFLESRPSGVYRVKGFVRFDIAGHRMRHDLHLVGTFLRCRRTRWSPEQDRVTSLVLIGRDIDVSAIRRELAACVVTESDRLTAQDMLCVLRYARD